MTSHKPLYTAPVRSDEPSTTANSTEPPPTESDLAIAALLLAVVKQDEEDDGLQYDYSYWTPTNRRLHQGKDI
ncbi:hypothetical protein EC957_009003 [Mortierella hygrophila]|uniref:Uncharacterized protein n=1 Tax=Mortierella hygrophila TaxID=979708 RepID=A0A9P6FBM8_9FUNG|nr:hypothetical protein EC957_009003 [Mortierella hygrophila]